MKKLISLLFLVCLGYSLLAQKSEVPYRQKSHFYNSVIFDKSPIIPPAIADSEAVRLDQVKELTNFDTEIIQTIPVETVGIDVQAVEFASYPTTFVKLTNSKTTTSLSLTDIPGLSVTLEAATFYEVDAFLNPAISSDSFGARFAIYYEDGIDAVVTGYWFGAKTSATTFLTPCMGFNSTDAVYFNEDHMVGAIMFKGTVYSGSEVKNLTLRFSKVSSGDVTVFPISFLKITKLF